MKIENLEYEKIDGSWGLIDFGQKEGFKTKMLEMGKMKERARES